MTVQASTAITFNSPPVLLSQTVLAQKKPLARVLLTLGMLGDFYANLGSQYIQVKASTMLEQQIKGYVWKTALKIISFILTAFILPMLALIAKAVYKNWAAKNITNIQAIISKDNQMRLQRMNRNFLEKIELFKGEFKNKNELESAYQGLVKLAEKMQQLGENDRLLFKDNDWVIHQRKQVKEALGLGNSTGSQLALQTILNTVRNAINLNITEVMIAGGSLSILDILSKVEKSSLHDVLKSNPSLQIDFSNLRQQVIDKITENVSQVQKDFESLPLPGKEKRELERLEKIRMSLPVNDDLLQQVLIKQSEAVHDKGEHRRCFPFLSNTALIEGLYFFEMTPASLVEDMSTLMSDPQTPLQVKSNLLNLFEMLLQSPYYDDELRSPEFSAKVLLFSQAIKNGQGNDFEEIRKKNNRDVEALHNQFLQRPALAKIEIELPLPDKIVQQEQLIETVKTGTNKEMQNLASNIAKKLPSYYALCLQKISYKNIMCNEFTDFANGVNAVLKSFDGVNDLLYNIGDRLDDEVDIRKMKERSKYFFKSLSKESFKLGDFLTTSTYVSKIDDLEKVQTIFNGFNRDENYREYEKTFKDRAMIPYMDMFFRNITHTIEPLKNISTLERVRFLNDSYKKLQEYQRCASLYPKVNFV